MENYKKIKSIESIYIEKEKNEDNMYALELEKSFKNFDFNSSRIVLYHNSASRCIYNMDMLICKQVEIFESTTAKVVLTQYSATLDVLQNKFHELNKGQILRVLQFCTGTDCLNMRIKLQGADDSGKRKPIEEDRAVNMEKIIKYYTEEDNVEIKGTDLAYFAKYNKSTLETMIELFENSVLF